MRQKIGRKFLKCETAFNDEPKLLKFKVSVVQLLNLKVEKHDEEYFFNPVRWVCCEHNSSRVSLDPILNPSSQELVVFSFLLFVVDNLD